jgi:hypothetical protein
MKLDKATAIRFQNAKITGKILSKGNAPVPDKDPDKVGNTQITVDVVVPAGLPGEPIGFVVVTSEGETLPRRLLLESTLPVTREKEPNDGFPQAQKIRIPHVVEGVIDRPRDVDVFQFEGKAGQKIDCEVLAARYGSPLDSILTLYDGKGREIASNDDMEATTDSRLIVTLPNTGAYYLTLIDANDSGSFIHVYRLVVKESR